MRIVRRASLLFSLVLIVAIIVGFLARSSELSGERDLGLTTAAEVGAGQLSAVIDSIEVAAATGMDAQTTAAAVTTTNERLGVCAADFTTVACAGDGHEIEASLTAALLAERRELDDPSELRRGVASVAMHDALLTIEVDGPAVSLLVQMPTDLVDDRNSYAVQVTTALPESISLGQFVNQDGVRFTSTMVGNSPGLFVVAAGDTSIPLPAEEQRFYLMIFTLAVLLMVLAGTTLVLEQRSLLERASVDPLTKLPNRGEFEQRANDILLSAQRHRSGVCMLLFDLNGFKVVNDTWGHHAGDEMLKVVASRLRDAVRDGDVVARWGGDEFVALMPGIATEEMGARRARQLAEQLCGLARLDSVPEPVRASVSVGIAISPTHGTDLDTLVESADQAMYEAKRGGTVTSIAASRSKPPVPSMSR
jgi:diguanylate cyclase (GGDEF)-like protein